MGEATLNPGKRLRVPSFAKDVKRNRPKSWGFSVLLPETTKKWLCIKQEDLQFDAVGLSLFIINHDF
jgi:hypothetical protein